MSDVPKNATSKMKNSINIIDSPSNHSIQAFQPKQRNPKSRRSASSAREKKKVAVSRENELMKKCFYESSRQINRYIQKCIAFSKQDTSSQVQPMTVRPTQGASLNRCIGPPLADTSAEDVSIKFESRNSDPRATEGALASLPAAKKMVKSPKRASLSKHERKSSFGSNKRENGSSDDTVQMNNLYVQLHMIQMCNKDKARLHEEIGALTHSCYSYLAEVRSLLKNSAEKGSTPYIENEFFDMFHEQSLSTASF
ncbi:hypothetical protein XU18_0279 [Perkinsela sp. CCAP 1560/4]|nr:hypothetical protein XU18_0279 [Perkinsela sp. CCAP 1560/4]|eukprot:KNH09594.1 hypothetical protein XU18_0279 [Perkinsela sp. CCAP 1560/4]